MDTFLSLLSPLVTFIGLFWAWLGIRTIVTENHRAGIEGMITITSKRTGTVALLVGCLLMVFSLAIFHLSR